MSQKPIKLSSIYSSDKEYSVLNVLSKFLKAVEETGYAGTQLYQHEVTINNGTTTQVFIVNTATQSAYDSVVTFVEDKNVMSIFATEHDIVYSRCYFQGTAWFHWYIHNYTTIEELSFWARSNATITDNVTAL